MLLCALCLGQAVLSIPRPIRPTVPLRDTPGPLQLQRTPFFTADKRQQLRK
jgi:hypothetical protein